MDKIVEVRPLNILDIKPNMYKITSDGHIINSNNEISRFFISNSGYYRINLMTNHGGSKNYSVHRLVALVFVDNPNNLPIVNHNNGNKLDNDASNLEWCTYTKNWYHANGMGTITNIGVSAFKHKPEKYSVELVVSICELLSEHNYKSNQIISALNLVKDPADKSSYEYRSMKKFIKNIRQRRCWKSISNNYTWA